MTFAELLSGPSISGERKQNLSHPIGADVFRVLAVASVGWFHIWQLSWVSGGTLDYWVRTGYLWVDGLILLSAFCLFLPYAGDWAENRELRKCEILSFYQKRAVRILPSYYVNLLAALLIALVMNGWTGSIVIEMLDHLFLTQNIFNGFYTHTMYNGVTWTLTVLAVFYLLFPFLVRLFSSHSLLLVTGLFVIQALWEGFALSHQNSSWYGHLINQVPAFSSTLAIGMMAALIFAKVGRSKAAQGIGFQAGASAAAVALLLVISRLLLTVARSKDAQIWQLQNRTMLAAIMAAFLVCLCLGLPIFGKPVWSFLSGISYNFYLWHQLLAVWMKYDLRFPIWAGDTPPNQLGNMVWAKQYNLLAWAAAFGAAVLFTYFVEKPAAEWLRKFPWKKSTMANSFSKFWED